MLDEKQDYITAAGEEGDRKLCPFFCFFCLRHRLLNETLKRVFDYFQAGGDLTVIEEEEE